MRIIVVSDTHGDNTNFLKVLELEKERDMIFHCGDMTGGEYTIIASACCPVEMVAGNNDFFSPLEHELEFDVAGKKVLLTHGHQYYVSVDTTFIKKEAISRGIDILCYGHTHQPLVDISKEIVVINPGSLTYPRQQGKVPTYAVLDIDLEGDVKVELKEISD